MGRVSARVDVPGQASEAEALWYDTRRWPAFVDGCKHVARVDGEWPQEGARVVWDTYPGGRGRVLERVVRYAAGDGQDVEVEDERMTATQSVRFAAAGDEQVRVSLELHWELKASYPGSGLVDALFIRRTMRESLRRTLRRFRIELAADRDLS